MKPLNKLLILSLLILIFNFSTGQTVFNPVDFAVDSDRLKPYFGKNKGNSAFCVVTGGLGQKGPAKFDLQDVSNLLTFGSTPNGKYMLGGDFGPDGIWYATEYSGEIYKIDTINGVFVLQDNPGSPLTGLTWSTADETFYACTGNELYILEIDTWNLILIGSMGNAGGMTGLGADNRGNLYGIDKTDDQFYKIDPYSGMASVVGPLGYDFEYLQNCAYDKNNDIMYHGGFMTTPSYTGALFSVDLQTGTAELLQEFPNTDEITSFAIPWLMPPHGTISGVVTDAVGGMPVENAIIYLEPLDIANGTKTRRITGADGNYEFGVILPGIYDLIAEHPNYGTIIIEEIQVDPEDNLIYDFELMEAPYSASFLVQDFSTNQPIEGATVNFAYQALFTNAQGVAVFENIAAGTYSYTVEKEGFYEGFGEVIIIDQNIMEDVLLYEENNIQKNLVIIEEATGTWCVACPTAAVALDQLYNEGYPVGIIAYHYNDNYENVYATARLGFYGIIAYPTLIFNGQNSIIGGSYPEYKAVVEDLMYDETPVSVGIENVVLNQTNNEISGTITIENFGPVNSENLKLQIILTESHIPEIWGGLEELNFVERTMFPDANGTDLDLTTINNYYINFTLDISEILDLEKCNIVVFVQDHFTKYIYNGLEYGCSQITDIQFAKEELPLIVFPNPFSDKIHIQTKTDRDFTNIVIRDSNGRRVFSKKNHINDSEFIWNATDFNGNRLEVGIYFLEVSNNDKILGVRKIYFIGK